MPLYVTNGKLQLGKPGQLAAQRACCCNEEGDDPRDCFCADSCIYQVEILEPAQFGPKPSAPCVASQDTPTSDFLKVVVTDDFPACFDADQCCGPVTTPVAQNPQNTYKLIAGNNAGFTTGGTGGIVFYDSQLDARAIAAFEIVCEIDQATKLPQYRVLVFFFVIVPAADGLVPRTPRRVLSKFADISLPSECRKKSFASCLIDAQTFRGAYLETPIQFTVSNSSAGLGDWDEARTSDEMIGDQARVTPCFEELVENFSATFRITQRHSCRIVDCGCSVDISGLKATFQGVELTLGTSYDQTFPEDGYDRRITHFFGFGVYYFTQYEILPGNLFRDELNIELFCDTDEDADPPVSRWYARFISKCRIIDEFTNITAETTRTEIGYFVCGESAGCGGRATGDPIPLGEATEIEEEPGSPVTADGLDACEPPTRASLSLSEDCGG